MFKSLTISRKLLLSSLIFLLPIAVLMYFFLVSYNQKIFFTEKEIEGNNLLYHNVTLGNLLGKYHREVFLHKANISDNTFKAKAEDVKVLENKIDKTISAILEEGKDFFADHKSRLKGDIAITSEYIKPEELAESWRKLKDHAASYDKQEFTDAYITIYKDLLSLIRYTGDVSNLILDPDLDSYYLMDISLLTIPDVIYKQSLIHHYGDKFLLADTLQRSEKQFSEFHLAHITDDIMQHIEKSLATSINSDNEFYDVSPTLADTLPFYFNKMHASYGEFTDFDSETDDTDYLNSSLYPVYERLSTELFNNVYDFWIKTNHELEILLEHRLQYYKNRRTIALVVSIVIIIFAFLSVVFTSSSISKHLRETKEIAEAIANGDIAAAKSKIDELRISSKAYKADGKIVKDEIILLFNSFAAMTDNLSELLDHVKLNAAKVNGSIDVIANMAANLEESVSKQAASTHEVKATSFEITETTSKLADMMNNVTKSFEEATNIASQSISDLEEIKTGLTVAINSTNNILDNFNDMEGRSKSISKITNSISKVASQTNILSLNASIEAKKAGEYGKGFSVVAKEIRILADQTSASALEIEKMIVNMQKSVENGLKTFQDFSAKSNQNSNKSKNIIDGIERIIQDSNKQLEMIKQVNQNMQGQSESAVQIDQAMVHLNEVSVSTKKAISEFNNENRKLNEVAGSLDKQLQRFKL